MVRRLWRRIRDERDERGDVPGWVLITLMTAVLVAGIWTFADEALGRILSNALCTITPVDGC